MSDGEAELIMRIIADNLQTYDQVTEVRIARALNLVCGLTRTFQLLSLLPPHHNGLLPLSFGLFHQEEVVRDLTVDIFNVLRSYPVRVCREFLDDEMPTPLRSADRSAILACIEPFPALRIRQASTCKRSTSRERPELTGYSVYCIHVKNPL